MEKPCRRWRIALGANFKAFDVTFVNKENQQEHGWATWGTNCLIKVLIGLIQMTTYLCYHKSQMYQVVTFRFIEMRTI